HRKTLFGARDPGGLPPESCGGRDDHSFWALRFRKDDGASVNSWFGAPGPRVDTVRRRSVVRQQAADLPSAGSTQSWNAVPGIRSVSTPDRRAEYRVRTRLLRQDGKKSHHERNDGALRNRGFGKPAPAPALGRPG